jgi:hypothetical protein
MPGCIGTEEHVSRNIAQHDNTCQIDIYECMYALRGKILAEKPILRSSSSATAETENVAICIPCRLPAQKGFSLLTLPPVLTILLLKADISSERHTPVLMLPKVVCLCTVLFVSEIRN